MIALRMERTSANHAKNTIVGRIVQCLAQDPGSGRRIPAKWHGTGARHGVFIRRPSTKHGIIRPTILSVGNATYSRTVSSAPPSFRWRSRMVIVAACARAASASARVASYSSLSAASRSSVDKLRCQVRGSLMNQQIWQFWRVLGARARRGRVTPPDPAPVLELCLAFP